jgi:hypothetical protein
VAARPGADVEHRRVRVDRAQQQPEERVVGAGFGDVAVETLRAAGPGVGAVVLAVETAPLVVARLDGRPPTGDPVDRRRVDGRHGHKCNPPVELVTAWYFWHRTSLPEKPPRTG